jgi:hypothetical protein
MFFFYSYASAASQTIKETITMLLACSFSIYASEASEASQTIKANNTMRFAVLFL